MMDGIDIDVVSEDDSDSEMEGDDDLNRPTIRLSKEEKL